MTYIWHLIHLEELWVLEHPHHNCIKIQKTSCNWSVVNYFFNSRTIWRMIVKPLFACTCNPVRAASTSNISVLSIFFMNMTVANGKLTVGLWPPHQSNCIKIQKVSVNWPDANTFYRCFTTCRINIKPIISSGVISFWKTMTTFDSVCGCYNTHITIVSKYKKRRDGRFLYNYIFRVKIIWRT